MLKAKLPKRVEIGFIATERQQTGRSFGVWMKEHQKQVELQKC